MREGGREGGRERERERERERVCVCIPVSGILALMYTTRSWRSGVYEHQMHQTKTRFPDKA